MKLPFNTLPELMQYFNSEERARDFMEKTRWPDGAIICPICGVRGAYRNCDFKTYTCRDVDCKSKFTVTVGTLMENTKIPLCKWFMAIWLITNHKKGISSCQLARDLGIGQKAAWFLNHRIRQMVTEKAPELLNDLVAVDEAHIGGRWANMNKTKRTQLHAAGIDNKTTIMGMVQKEGKAKLFVIGNSTLKQRVRQHVNPNAVLVTDEQIGYSGLAKEYRDHITVNHSLMEFKKDGFSTNAVEGLFSLFKRSIIGIYHQISPQHLHRYCTETVYRYNTRKIKDVTRFLETMKKTQGRLTYKELIKDSPKPKSYTGIEFVNGE
jgi:hypothetical protein